MVAHIQTGSVFTGGDTRVEFSWTIQLLLLFYGIFYGLAHACMLSVPYIGLRRESNFTGSLLFTISLVVLVTLVSHVLFYWVAHHPKNIVQPAIALLAILVTTLLTWDRIVPMRAYSAEKRTPKLKPLEV